MKYCFVYLVMEKKSNMRKLSLLLISIAVFALSIAPAFAQETTEEALPTIAEIVVASTTAETPEFTLLLTVIQAADPSVLSALSDPNNSLTVFAPTDAAFMALINALGQEAVGELLANPEALTDILLFHVSPFFVDSATVGMVMEMMGGKTAPLVTLNGQYIDVALDADGNPTINGANLVAVDIPASNGIIHVIDAVILPESRDIATIVTEFAGAETPEFSTLLTAVVAADLAGALADPEAELTVFAPTDAAFAALPAETLEAALADLDLLTAVLTYHVVAGKVYTADISEAQYWEVGGEEVPAWFAGLSENGGCVD